MAPEVALFGHGSGRSTMFLNWKQVMFCAFLLAFGISSLHAQRTSGTAVAGGVRGGGMRSGPAADISGPSVFQPMPQPGGMQPMIPDQPPSKAEMVEDESCLPWALSSIRGATVSVMRLQVPDKARSEYDKACSDFKKKKFAEAEEHFRGAIEKYSNYV